MDWMKLHAYSRKRQTQKNVRCPSPVPGVAASVTMGRRHSKAKGPQPCQVLLSKPGCKPVRKQFGNTIATALPKIQETSDVAPMGCLSAEQSIEFNYNENRCVEKNIDISETDTVLKDSLQLNSASKKSPRNSETASGMTLPTGVSDFLLHCLDADSTMCCDTELSDYTCSYSSPEIFREERSLEGSTASPEEGWHIRCKNSTLLDTSKAINIDKMQQLPNLSKILGNSKHVKRSIPEHYKIDNQQPRKMKCRKKIKFKNLLENTASSSSPVILGSVGRNQSAISCTGTAEAFLSKLSDADMEIRSRAVNIRKNKDFLTSTALLQPEDLELDLSSVHKVSQSEDILPNTSSLYINSEEIVPVSLSPERMIRQHLRNKPEICSIIKASPGLRPVKVIQHPLNRKTFFPPESTEDIIASSENWESNNDR
ncbi:meiosis-specific kinetochore protein [Varanus komodoensis]|uniref:meiosis-specific kinetochore protein n=1 Tax=Varanus komodoensis TaxID=61221 RepID=UPI001CF7A3C0|nr:meiosis-specific kinetochore protein [Varanus komodoensis]